MTRKENNIVLFSITLCWASSYVFIKSLPPDLSSYAYLTLTTGIAGIILLFVFYKKIKEVNKKILIRGFIMSLLMIGNLLSEKAGIDLIPASNASFISALSILMVPLMLLFLHKFPNKNNVFGIIVIVIGLGITNGFNLAGFLNKGTFYMISGCMFMAIYTILADKFTKEIDPLMLGITQIWFTAAIAFILWTIENPYTFASLTYTNEMLSSIFILAFFAKAYAYIMLMYSQKYTNPLSVTIIASLEPVVTLVLAILMPSVSGKTEVLQLSSVLGAGCIALGAVIGGTTFLQRKKVKIKAQNNEKGVGQ